MTKKTFNFKLGESASLNLKSLFAQVTVRKGELGVATVEMEGDEDLVKEITVSQPNPGEIRVEGTDQDGGNGNITIIQSGRSNRKSTIVMGNVRGLVITNGQVISGGSNVRTIEGLPKPVVITITVPEGTELDAESVEELDSQGLNGKLYLSLDGQGKAKIRDVNSAKISCSGQTIADVGNIKGDAKLGCSGQSKIAVYGNFGDVEADASGQSRIRIVGDCHDCEGSASGQSTITLTGHASGKVRKHESGQSSVDIN